MLDEKLLITMQERDKVRLKELAAANTSGNLSAMVRSLINRSYMMPSEFGLMAPESQPEPHQPEPA